MALVWAEYVFSDGLAVRVRIRRNTRRRVIVRALAHDCLQLSLPSRTDGDWWWQWLRRHEAEVLRLLHTVPAVSVPQEMLLYGGTVRVCWQAGAAEAGVVAGGVLYLPDAGGAAEKRAALQSFLYRTAAPYLLPRLDAHARATGLLPDSVGLSRAGTYWGVCRRRRILLNWRLVGAPEWVADYVCLHELCHLLHAGHQAPFRRLLARYAPDAAAAEGWLKAYGGRLFVCG